MKEGFLLLTTDNNLDISHSEYDSHDHSYDGLVLNFNHKDKTILQFKYTEHDYMHSTPKILFLISYTDKPNIGDLVYDIIKKDFKIETEDKTQIENYKVIGISYPFENPNLLQINKKFLEYYVEFYNRNCKINNIFYDVDENGNLMFDIYPHKIKYSKQDMINFACDVYNKYYCSDKSFKEIANNLINEKPYGEFI